MFDSNAEVFWDIVANPIENGDANDDTLAQLAEKYPQSNLLHLLAARHGDHEKVKKAAVYSAGSLLRKLTTNGSDLSNNIASYQLINISDQSSAQVSNINVDVETASIEENYTLSGYAHPATEELTDPQDTEPVNNEEASEIRNEESEQKDDIVDVAEDNKTELPETETNAAETKAIEPEEVDEFANLEPGKFTAMTYTANQAAAADEWEADESDTFQFVNNSNDIKLPGDEGYIHPTPIQKPIEEHTDDVFDEIVGIEDIVVSKPSREKIVEDRLKEISAPATGLSQSEIKNAENQGLTSQVTPSDAKTEEQKTAEVVTEIPVAITENVIPEQEPVLNSINEQEVSTPFAAVENIVPVENTDNISANVEADDDLKQNEELTGTASISENQNETEVSKEQSADLEIIPEQQLPTAKVDAENIGHSSAADTTSSGIHQDEEAQHQRDLNGKKEIAEESDEPHYHPFTEEIKEQQSLEGTPKEKLPAEKNETTASQAEPEKALEDEIIGSIVATDYFGFTAATGKSEPQQPQKKEVAAKDEVKGNEPQTMAKYHDDNMPYSFLWWLDKTRREHANTYQPFAKKPVLPKIGNLTAPPPTQPFAEHKKTDTGEIIERFIQEEPQIKPIINDRPDNENKARTSAEDADDMVTETLARIYTEQMLFHKAIDTYKKLMLRYPEKSGYFASQIHQLENRIN